MSNNLSVAPVAQMSSRVGTLAPVFMLPARGIVFIGGEKHHVERRLPDGRWQFLTEEYTPRFLSDAELASMMSRGEFHLDACHGVRTFAPPPLSPLLVGPTAHAANQRRHDYVLACLNAPRFKRSRPLLRRIIRNIAESRNEKPPGFTTVLTWIDEWEIHGERIGTAAYSDRHDLKGRHRDILMDWQEVAMEAGVEVWLQGATKVEAYKTVCRRIAEYDAQHGQRLNKAALGSRFVDDRGALRPPALRTFERRCSDVNRFEQDWARVGPAYAKQRNRTWQRIPLPDRPYSEVEVDHTPVDVLIVDHQRNLVLGRPNLTFFRDRATAMVLGYGLGFEVPSYASFLQGLKHATYPKGPPLSHNAAHDWPCYGRIENLYVDNGLEFLGDSIRAAGRELGFNLVRFQPRQPWLKGSLERLFGTLNTGLLHSLPGTTLSNVLERRDHEHLGDATFTLSEFEALLDWWIREEYHARPTRGLGFIRGAGGIPLEAWAEKSKSYRTPLLPDPELFLTLAGEVAYRTIQSDGISWDHITYEGPELWALLSDPRHRRRGDGKATRYEIVRDPFDLGSILVKDPYRGEPIRVFATLAHQPYASGLTLHQHQVIISNATPRKPGDKLDLEDLSASRALLADVVAALRRNPGRKKVQRALGRYLHVEQSRRHRSQILLEQPAKSPSGMVDWTTASKSTPPATGSATSADETHSQHDRTHVLSDDDDLDEIRRSKAWSVYNDK